MTIRIPLPPILAGGTLEKTVVSKLKRGCVVYRDLWPSLSGLADAVVGPVARLAPQEHSGIYIGGGEVVSLDGDGDVVSESLDEFREGQSIYVSCRRKMRRPSSFGRPISFDGKAVGDGEVADRAEDMVGSSRSYNPILDNCHQFASGCLTGDFENSDNFLWMLKDTASEELGADAWGIFEED